MIEELEIEDMQTLFPNSIVIDKERQCIWFINKDNIIVKYGKDIPAVIPEISQYLQMLTWMFS